MALHDEQECMDEAHGTSSLPTLSPVGSGVESSSNEHSQDGFDGPRPSGAKPRTKGRTAHSKAAPRTSNAENQARYRARCKARREDLEQRHADTLAALDHERSEHVRLSMDTAVLSGVLTVRDETLELLLGQNEQMSNVAWADSVAELRCGGGGLTHEPCPGADTDDNGAAVPETQSTGGAETMLRPLVPRTGYEGLVAAVAAELNRYGRQIRANFVATLETESPGSSDSLPQLQVTTAEVRELEARIKAIEPGTFMAMMTEQSGAVRAAVAEADATGRRAALGTGIRPWYAMACWHLIATAFRPKLLYHLVLTLDRESPDSDAAAFVASLRFTRQQLAALEAVHRGHLAAMVAMQSSIRASRREAAAAVGSGLAATGVAHSMGGPPGVATMGSAMQEYLAVSSAAAKLENEVAGMVHLTTTYCRGVVELMTVEQTLRWLGRFPRGYLNTVAMVEVILAHGSAAEAGPPGQPSPAVAGKVVRDARAAAAEPDVRVSFCVATGILAAGDGDGE